MTHRSTLFFSAFEVNGQVLAQQTVGVFASRVAKGCAGRKGRGQRLGTYDGKLNKID